MFFVSCYGAEYVQYLYTCLYSIKKYEPEAGVCIFYDDIENFEISLLKNTFSNYKFKHVKTVASDCLDKNKAISYKLLHWSEFLLQNQRIDRVIFLDVDILLVNNVSNYLPDSDIVYTFQNSRIPINTGFIGVNNTSLVREFVNEWMKVTNNIISDKYLLKEAIRKSGGADQQAIIEMLGGNVSNTETMNNIDFNGDVMSIGSVPCTEFNQTFSVKAITNEKALHFKSGFRSVVNSFGVYNTKRTKDSSHFMYSLWNDNYRSISSISMEGVVAKINSVNFFDDVLLELGLDHVLMIMSPEKQDSIVRNKDTTILKIHLLLDWAHYVIKTTFLSILIIWRLFVSNFSNDKALLVSIGNKPKRIKNILKLSKSKAIISDVDVVDLSCFRSQKNHVFDRSIQLQQDIVYGDSLSLNKDRTLYLTILTWREKSYLNKSCYTRALILFIKSSVLYPYLVKLRRIINND